MRGRAACLATLSLAITLLPGCASFTPDGGFGEVAQLSQARTGQAPSYQRRPEDLEAAQARVTALLQQPLSAETAVQIALLGNRELQARYAELGLAEAERVRAGRPANPSLSWGRLSGGGAVEVDRAVTLDLLGLLTLPLAQQLAQGSFQQAQLQAADDTVSLAAEARQAFFEAVAARQLVAYFEQVRVAAELSNELARRMVAAGNFSALDQMREQAFYSDATIGLARAQQAALASREQLVRCLGLSGDQLQALQLPERLPELPAQAAPPQAAEQTAMDQRLDVMMARQDVAATAQALGLSQATRWVNVLTLGYQTQRSSGEARKRGYEITLELPLFDFGATRAAQAEARYMQALHRAAAVALRAQSEVRQAHAAYLSAYALARHYRDELVPLRKRISDEQLLRYNGMLTSVFSLLADAKDQTAAVSGAVQALRDFWVADTQLQTALTGRSPVAAAASAGLPRAAAEASAGH